MRIFLIISILTCSCFLRGQVWTNLIDSVPQQQWAVFSNAVVDSNSNTLYLGGEFYRFNQFNTNSIIKYNGVSFDTLQTGLDDQEYNQAIVKSMQIFQNKLYVFGNFKKTGKYWCNNIGRWNGLSWDTVNFHPKNGAVWQSDVYNNELYIAGTFDTIAGIATNCVAKYDGTNWYSMAHPVPNNIITAIKNYKGKTYIAGQVTTASSSANLSYWDGSSWMPWVGVSGDNAKSIFGMTVIDSMLYVYGRFNSIAGTNCRGLAAFNGTQWYGYGVGTANSSWETIYSIKKINGELYATGMFNDIQGVSTGTVGAQLYTNFAKFDGQKWCTVSPPFGNVVCSVIGYNNNMFAYGAFRKVGADSVYGFVKWNGGNTTIACSSTLSITSGTVGLDEIINFGNLKIYPNPVKDKLNIEMTFSQIESLKIEVINALGQKIFNSEFFSHNNQIDLAAFPVGIYFIKIQKDFEQKIFKIIKE